MWYGPDGYRWDGTPAMRWQCTGTAKKPCENRIWDGDLPWHITIYRDGLFRAFLHQYGTGPVTNSKPPADFAVQLRMF
jgi:hypothetical protein